jgi:CTD nuclear envelope phosphatase 1
MFEENFKEHDDEFLALLDKIELKKRKLLILDLDNTLIFTNTNNEEKKEDFQIIFDEKCYFYGYKRPYLDKFIDYIIQYFDIAVWSAGNEYYVNSIIDSIFGDRKYLLQFVYYKTHCHKSEHNGNEIFVKYINKSDSSLLSGSAINIQTHSLDNIIILDDNYHAISKNLDNAIRIKSWHGDKNDDKLLECIDILNKLKFVNDVRVVVEENKYYDGF